MLQVDDHELFVDYLEIFGVHIWIFLVVWIIYGSYMDYRLKMDCIWLI